MSAPIVLTASQRALFAQARPAFTATGSQFLTAARAFHALNTDEGLSLSRIVTVTREQEWTYAPSKTRLSVILATFRDAPEDVTGRQFDALLKAATSKNRGEEKREGAHTVTADTADTADTAAPTASEPASIPVTVEAIIALADSLTADDQARLVSALVKRYAALTIAA